MTSSPDQFPKLEEKPMFAILGDEKILLEGHLEKGIIGALSAVVKSRGENLMDLLAQHGKPIEIVRGEPETAVS